MPRACSAFGCSNVANKPECQNVSFHIFPSEEKIRTEWTKALHRKNFIPGKYTYLCSDHFSATSFIPELSRKKLYPNAIPTIFPSLPFYMQTPPVKKPVVSEKRILSSVYTSHSSHPETTVTSSNDTAAVSSTIISAPTNSTDLEMKVIELQNEVANLKKKLVTVRKRSKLKQEQKCSLIKKVNSLKQLTDELRKRNLIYDEMVVISRRRFSYDDAILISQFLSKRKASYSNEVKELAGTF